MVLERGNRGLISEMGELIFNGIKGSGKGGNQLVGDFLIFDLGVGDVEVFNKLSIGWLVLFCSLRGGGRGRGLWVVLNGERVWTVIQ